MTGGRWSERVGHFKEMHFVLGFESGERLRQEMSGDSNLRGGRNQERRTFYNLDLVPMRGTSVLTLFSLIKFLKTQDLISLRQRKREVGRRFGAQVKLGVISIKIEINIKFTKEERPRGSRKIINRRGPRCHHSDHKE